MTTETKKAAAPKTFKWSPELGEQIAAAYTAQIEADEGKVETANSAPFLDDLARSVGASGARSVRQKLAQLGVYVKGEVKTANPNAGAGRLKKVILASLICDAVAKQDDSLGDGLADILGGLEHATRPALLAILAVLEGRKLITEDLES